MALKEKLNSDLYQALKNKESLRVETLRFILSNIHNKEIEKRAKGDSVLKDEEIIEVLNREAKKRKEAAEIYDKGGRSELKEKEIAELKIIQEYLPEQLNEAEIKKVIEEVLLKLEVKDGKEFGKVMAEIMKQLKGKADATIVNKIVKEKLGM